MSSGFPAIPSEFAAALPYFRKVAGVSEESIADRMRELLAFANYSKVARELDVSKSAVSAWANGRDVTPFRLDQVERLLLRAAPAIAEPSAIYDVGELTRKVDAIITRDEVLELVDDAKRAIVSEVQLNREALYTAIADELVAKALPRLLEELRAERSNGTQDPPPGTAGRPPGPRA